MKNVAIGLLIGLLLGGGGWFVPRAWAQAPGIQPLPGEVDAAPVVGFQQNMTFKLTFAVFDQFSYEDHPFATITGNEAFNDAVAGYSSSGSFGTAETDRDANFIEQVIHSLPPFGIEYMWNFDAQFPKGIGVGLDYLHFFQDDSNSISGTLPPTLPRFRMDTYYYGIPVRFYGNEPRTQGINYFIGFSVGQLNGNMLVASASPAVEDQIIHFSQSGVGATRLGLDVNGVNFGFRYELMIINARKVKLNNNPFPGQATNTEIEMSGSMVRISFFRNFQ